MSESAEPTYTVNVLHIGETIFALQLSFFLMSLQSDSDPPAHQKESLNVHMQENKFNKSNTIKYLTSFPAVYLS